MLAGTDAGTGGEGSCTGVGGNSAVQPHSMGGVMGGRRGTHTPHRNTHRNVHANVAPTL